MNPGLKLCLPDEQKLRLQVGFDWSVGPDQNEFVAHRVAQTEGFRMRQGTRDDMKQRIKYLQNALFSGLLKTKNSLAHGTFLFRAVCETRLGRFLTFCFLAISYYFFLNIQTI